MKTISIRELHLNTGKYVREASRSGRSLIVSDRGRPAARLMPLEDSLRRKFSDRRLVKGFEKLPELLVDSGRMLEEDRK